MPKSYNDPVKQLAREKQRDFIKRHLLSVRRPRDVYVVCFPGAEQEGEEALEVREIYDPLGIPRSNIVGLEYDAVRADRLRRANLGIEVVHSSDAEYFYTTDRHFDVVGLDYTGSKSKILPSIRFILERRLLNSLSVLSCNNYVGRENIPDQDLLKRVHGITKRLEESLEADRYFEPGELDNLKTDDLADARDEFTRYVVTSVVSPELPPGFFDFQNKMVDKLADEFIKYLENNIDDPGDEARNLALRALYILSIRYSIPNIERYRYRSNSGANMDLDIFGINDHKRRIDRVKDFVEYAENSESLIKVSIRDEGEFRKFWKFVDAAFDEMKDSQKIHLQIPNRVYLGSSYQPPPVKQHITREEAIALLDAGFSAPEIAREYSGFKDYELRGLKAWRTKEKRKAERASHS